MRLMTPLALGALAVALALPVHAQGFTETFDDGNAASRFTSASIGTPVINYAYDYSEITASRPAGIPPAPNSGGSTIGLRMASRTNANDAAGAAAAIYNGAELTGDFTMTFDMWINYNGGPLGGSGSTEMAFWGLNNTGSGVLIDTFAGGTAEGYAFTATGEGGAGGDYRVYYTDPTDDGSEFPKANATWAAGGNTPDADGNQPDNNLHNFYDDPLTGLFPSPPFETPGAPGKQWVAVKVEQTGNAVSTYFNGALISTLTLAEAADGEGSPYFSYADIFTGSTSGNLPDSFVVFDNLQVIPEPATVSLAAAALGLMGLTARRRRK